MAKLPVYYEAHHPDQPGKFFMPSGTEKNIESALRYKAKPGDLFLCNYPKCGITWMQSIVWRITHRGQPITATTRKYVAFIEYDGGEAAEATRSADSEFNIIKTHFPYKWVPKHPGNKYIFITREPKDVCVSLYHHMKRLPEYAWEDGSFGDVVDSFLRGKLDVGDYFEILNEWYEIRDDPIILFLLYEDLLTSPKETIMKIAEFLGPKYVEELSANNFEYLEEIVQETSLRSMKQIENPALVRKGTIGDWKNHMTPSQAAAIDQRLQDASQRNGTEKLWLKWKQN